MLVITGMILRTVAPYGLCRGIPTDTICCLLTFNFLIFISLRTLLTPEVTFNSLGRFLLSGNEYQSHNFKEGDLKENI